MAQQWKDILLPRVGDSGLVNSIAEELNLLRTSAKSDEEFVSATMAPSQRTVGNAVVEYYGAGNPASLSDSEQQSLRLRLFETRPTETLAGLVKGGKLLMPTEASRKLAELVLLSAVEQGINISKQSLPSIDQDLDKSDLVVSKQARSHVAALQRLHRLVRDPLHISALLAQGFLSANSIAATERDTFVQLVGNGHGSSLTLSENAAITIWQQATLIDLRNARLWTDFIMQREGIPVLALEKEADTDSPTTGDGSDQSITMETLFREHDSVVVDEYSSALSPSAYLVDLLQLLRYSYLNPLDKNETSKPSRLLTSFLARRPDVANLQLSEANTTTLVRYADLVNETLEAFIAGAAQLEKTPVPADPGASTSQNGEAYEQVTPQSTDWRVYANVIQLQKSPPSCAPFNMGRYACREYFKALGLSLYELLELFSPLSLNFEALPQSEAKEQAQLNALIEMGLERQLAAESLSLSPEEFVMITKEAFQSSALISQLHGNQNIFTQEEYAKRIGLISTGEYWGFVTDDEDSANDKMAGKITGIDGINNIEAVLLPRSGLQFSELLELLKTELLSQRLVISVETSKGTFSGKLKDMKLSSTNIQQQEIEDILNIEDCADLLSLIRLWRTLGWKLQDLDNAIVTLSLSRISGEAVPPTSAIDAELLLELAAIKELAALASIEVNKLIPLWGAMRLSSPNSLYKSLFFKPRYLKQYPALHDFSNADSQLPKPLIKDLMTPLLLALGLTPEEFQTMSQALGIAETAPWSLVNFSRLYRHNLLRQMLGISLKEYFSLPIFNYEDTGPLQSPRQTLSVVKKWKALQEGGFSNKLLLNAFGSNNDSEIESNSAQIVGLAAEMLSALQVFAASGLSSTALSTTRGQLYGLNTANAEDLKLFSVIDSLGTQSSLLDYLLHPDTVQVVRKVQQRLNTAADIVNTAKLSQEELDYFTDRLSFDRPVVQDLELLCDHVKARALIKPKSDMTILELYRAGPFLPQNSGNLETLCNQISKATGFELLRVQELMTAYVTKARSAAAIDAKSLIHLSRMIIQWSALTTPEDTTPIYEAAKSLEKIVTVRSGADPAKAIENVAMQKRESLVQHLMSLSAKYHVPTDVEGLFEYFLVDVKMGPQQETSRIKQAISTVQLFIQRCLLGLEKKNNIPTTAIKRDTWAWMSKFVLWQANRKVFLYPENWIEPSLRDDKSETFRSIETVILQSNLNMDVIGSIFRRYIYDTNDIADLQIMAYFWEAGPNFLGKYHIFARTRTAPYQYYYRVFEVSGVHADSPRFNWFPWTKLEVEIAALEVDWDGKSLDKAGAYLVPTVYRGRLFLFIPQILLRTRPKAASSTTIKIGETIQSQENQQYWEIKIGWVEYRNGKWSKKEVSSSGIEVEGYKPQPNDPGSISAEAKKMPSISSFHFRASARTSPATDKTETVVPSDNILVLDVYRWFQSLPSDYQQIHLGRFELRGTQMVVCDFKDTSTAWKHTIPTKFQQLDHKTSVKEETQFKAELRRYWQYNPSLIPANEQQPLLTLPPHIDELDTDSTQKLTWTVSYNEFQATVSHVDSYFGIIGRDDKGRVGSSRDTSSIVTRSDGLEGLFHGLETVPQSKLKTVFATANSIYSWELGFHLVLLLMERLYATQQFELALQIASFVFDPRADDEPSSTGDDKSLSNKSLSNLDRCWRFVPFKNSKLRLAGSTRQVVQRLSAGHNNSNDISDWLANPFNPHAIARGRPSIYMRRFIIKYIQILIAAGDVYFREDTLESIPLALQRYVQASQLFGKRPELLPQQTKPVTKSYNAIFDNLDDFGSAEIDMEIYAPYYIQPSGQANASAPYYNGVQGMVRSPYFPVPANPQMVALRDLIDDRFFKIRNSLDINGNFRHLQLFEPPLDPGQLVRSMATGGMASVVANALIGPMPNVRFALLLQKAFEIIKEKKDAEALSALRSRQDLAMQNVALRNKQLARDDMSQVMRLNYFLALTGESSGRQSIAQPTDAELYDEAQELTVIATAIENRCSILMALPEVHVQAQPMGKIADGMMLVASASRASRKAQLIKQLQDRRLQANQAGYEIMATDKSIESQRIKIDMAEADISMAKQQIDDLALYSWMDASARKLLAEKAFMFERPTRPTSENGAFAAQNLYLDLKRIESLNLQGKPHDFEVKKSISLRQIDPWALLQFQDTGKTEFMLPEVLFDYDFPGHHCRRIKSLSVTIPCIVGPYTSVACTLRLLEHGYRLRQKQNGAAYYPVGSLNSDLPVALSSSFQDNGTFEMEFGADERYGPFEGAGVVSRWSLELPSKTPQFDYHTISDVVINAEASDAVTKFQESADAQMHVALFDLRDGLTRLTSTGDTPKLTVANVSSLLPFWTRGREIVFSKFWLVASKGSSLLGDNGGDNLPSLPESLIGSTFDVVATEEDTTQDTETKDIVIELNSLKGKDYAAIRAAQGQRLWLLAEYHVKL
ncbi:hypothetical protein GGI42DRAFT_359397 [Trichoderma sp. SZMC 28013]